MISIRNEYTVGKAQAALRRKNESRFIYGFNSILGIGLKSESHHLDKYTINIPEEFLANKRIEV